MPGLSSEYCIRRGIQTMSDSLELRYQRFRVAYGPDIARHWFHYFPDEAHGDLTHILQPEIMTREKPKNMNIYCLAFFYIFIRNSVIVNLDF